MKNFKCTGFIIKIKETKTVMCTKFLKVNAKKYFKFSIVFVKHPTSGVEPQIDNRSKLKHKRSS